MFQSHRSMHQYAVSLRLGVFFNCYFTEFDIVASSVATPHISQGLRHFIQSVFIAHISPLIQASLL